MCETRLDLRSLELAHLFVSRVLVPGDSAVDATMGNGHDTEFLAGLVGEQGHVTGFDIQERALESTRARLAGSGLECQSELHLASHAEMSEFVREAPSAIMFNLGYLPGGDKTLVTRPGETRRALEAAFSLLKNKGILTVMCYPGHAGGREECDLVEELFRNLPKKEWTVTKAVSHNGKPDAPFLLAAVKG